MRIIPRMIATGFFVGYAPFAPGTVGSLLGLFFYWAIPESDTIFSLLVCVFLFVVGAWSATEVEKESGKKDDPKIVIDEIVGILITFIFFKKDLRVLTIGFFLFRFFDIIKLYPAKLSERLPRGWGVMMDDVIAGIYSAVALRLIFLFMN